MKKTLTRTARGHIALYIGSLNMGGAERVMVNLAEALFSRGWRVTFVTTYIADEEYEVPHGSWRILKKGEEREATADALDINENHVRVGFYNAEKKLSDGDIAGLPGDGDHIGRVFSGVATAEAGGRAAGLVRRIKVLRRVWRAIKPDIILSFLGKNNLMALLSSTGTGIPVAVSVRALPELEYPGKLMRLAAFILFSRAAGVVVQTNAASEFFPKKIRKRTVVLPNAVSDEFLVPRYRGERERTVVSVGRLDANKNTAMLIRAFAGLKSESGTAAEADEYRLVIYGDGEEAESLKQLADGLGLKGSIHFAGNTDNIAEKIKRASVFVLSSDTEGMPNTLIEAMCLGLACISTDCPCGGPSELIEDGVNGLLTPVGDEAALKEALRRVITDREFADRLGVNASSIQDRFKSGAVTDRWESFLEIIRRGEAPVS